jgi:glycerol-3-phosphate dehydrogenase
VGFRIGRGEAVAEILAGMQQVAEGATTAAPVVALAERYGVELPICQQVAAVLQGASRPSEAVGALLGRPPTQERSPGLVAQPRA